MCVVPYGIVDSSSLRNKTKVKLGYFLNNKLYLFRVQLKIISVHVKIKVELKVRVDEFLI